MTAKISAPSAEPSTADILLREAEEKAERRTGLTRILVALVLIVAVEIAADGIPQSEAVLLRQIDAARVTLTGILIVGVIGYTLARRGSASRILSYLTATADVLLILGNLAYNHLASGVASNFFSTFPVVWVLPITMAAAALRYQPRLQAYVAFLCVGGLSAIMIMAGTLPISERAEAMAKLSFQFGVPPNMVRLVMIAATALILVLVARQGRVLLERAVAETTRRLAVGRYLPRELAPLLADGRLDRLRTGRRVQAAVLFLDMRDSTRIAETMDPARLAVFITAFRRRVMRAAEATGGMVDKFIGDGALIVFGVPEARGDEAARALACARHLAVLVARWNAKRQFDPPVRIGIGVHAGDVFWGVVGDESRLEFTVLGDTVNVASRLQDLTKVHGVSILASDVAVEAAGDMQAWRLLSSETLRGRAAPLGVMAPALDQAAGPPFSGLVAS